jgi:uncharacterized protein
MRFIVRSILICLLLTAAIVHAAPPVPKLEGPVNDYAHVLSPADQSRLSDFLTDQESKTSNQIVVLTIPSLNGDDLEDFSLRVARDWNLGQKDKKNGVLVLVAVNDHKIRIEVNGGLQGVLTDALATQIIRNEIAPHFKADDYFGGLMAGVTAIDQATHGEYKAKGPPPQAHQAVHVDTGAVLFWMIFFIIILASHVRFHRYRNHWLGPVWISSPSSGFGSGGFSSGGGFSGGGGYSGGGGGGGFDGGGASGGW